MICCNVLLTIALSATVFQTTYGITFQDQMMKHYGENCSDLDNSTTVCNVKECLACINSTCTCSENESMIFDPARGMCVGKAGHRCLLHLSEVSVPPLKRIGSCVTFSSCELSDDENIGRYNYNKNNNNSTCRCWSSFYPDESTGFCLRRKEYLQKCERDEQCNNRKGFICNKDVGACTCDTNIHRYNPDSERCIGLPNKECGNQYRECTENHKCKSGICRCKFKEVEAVNGTLLCDPVKHKYGKTCGRFRGDCGDNEYDNNLRCLDGKCRCKNPDYQIYDHDRRLCVSKVGGPCSIITHLSSTSESFSDPLFNRNNSKFNSESFPAIQCISYAHCVATMTPKNSTKNASNLPHNTNPRGVCECGESFIETKKGMCSLPFGSDCDTSPKNKKDECASPLKCVSGRCGCPNEVDVYESETKKCSKSVQSLCWKDASCVSNASCQKLGKSNNTNKGMPGRCKCMSKFKATPLATCA